ncbi:MAG: (d)CMP kinase [Treponema sp.]|nr:(d)CMP kinase [Treponema sp.]
MVIAIDGPAGTGKSTIAARIAQALGITYLNSGSFYRALTLALLRAGIDISDEAAIVSFCGTQRLDYESAHLILNGEDVEHLLHDDAVSAHAASVSAIPAVRHIVNARLRDITQAISVVSEGRDMTTVVFPHADYKFYLDASIAVRAERRFRQGVSSLSRAEIAAAISARDDIDRHKAEGSLVRAPDAFYIDTSRLTIEEVCAIILDKVNS